MLKDKCTNCSSYISSNCIIYEGREEFYNDKDLEEILEDVVKQLKEIKLNLTIKIDGKNKVIIPKLESLSNGFQFLFDEIQKVKSTNTSNKEELKVNLNGCGESCNDTVNIQEAFNIICREINSLKLMIQDGM